MAVRSVPGSPRGQESQVKIDDHAPKRAELYDIKTLAERVSLYKEGSIPSADAIAKGFAASWDKDLYGENSIYNKS